VTSDQPAPEPVSVAVDQQNDPSAGIAKHVHYWNDPLPVPPAEARGLLGGKATSLSAMHSAGLPVPPAFTITTEACRLYHAHDRQWPQGLWYEIQAAIARLETATGRRFGSGDSPLTFAVRSGAAESMPGLMATILHCGLSESLVEHINDDRTWEAFAGFLEGYAHVQLQRLQPGGAPIIPTNLGARQRCEQLLQQLTAVGLSPLPDDPQALLRAVIAAVFDSWDSAAARRFREVHGWSSVAGTAVTVQAMFPAEVSGVVFSRNPIRPHDNDLVVEVTLGLGHLLVAGQVTPWRWRIDREACSVRDEDDSRRRPASGLLVDFAERGLKRTCLAALRIEELFQAPVDVEFGYAAGELVFFQARPIAPSANCASQEAISRRERTRLLDWANEGRKLWVRHNLADTLPAPTPLTWDIWRQFMSGSGGYGAMYRRLGFQPSRRVCREGFLELILGRIYADPQRLPEMFCAGYPLVYDKAVLRLDPGALNRGPTDFDIEQLDPWFLLRWPVVAAVIVRSQWRTRRLPSQVAARFNEDVVPRLRGMVADERRHDLSQKSLEGLIEIFERRRRLVFDVIAPATLLPGTLAASAWSSLEHSVLSILGELDGHRLVRKLLQGIPEPTLDRQRQLMSQLAAGEASMDRFLMEFGHRGPNEMDLSAPRWRECPDDVRAAARCQAVADSRCSRNAPDPSGDAELRAALLSAGAGCLYRDISAQLRRATTLLPFREAGKHELLRGYELIRDVLQRLTQRLNLGDGIHFLSAAELHKLPSGYDFRSLISERRHAHRLCRSLHAPAVLEVAGDLAGLGLPPSEPLPVRTMPATSLAPGRAEGRVHLLPDARRSAELPHDAVVVVSTIDPAMVPFLAGAAALVVEQGGILSHVALLTRRMSLPTVVVARITSFVVDGEPICVDADGGFIQLKNRPA